MTALAAELDDRPHGPPPEGEPAAIEAEPADRLGPPPPADRLRGWLVALSLALVGGVVRMWNLGFPTDKGTPVFDEKHYVPQAAQVLRNGGYEDNPGYELVVHPPLGKQLIAISEAMFGYTGWGWRFASAVAGTLCVLMIVRIGRRLTRSTLLGAIAGVLLICDGVSHVQARMGMLDVFLATFVLAAFGCLVADRDQVRRRLAAALREGGLPDRALDLGPRLGFRWWRLAGGICLGLACGVKWSGLYFFIGFALLSVVWDVTARRAAGVRRPVLGMATRDLAPALWALVAVPLLMYLATWWAWFGSETAIDRHAVGTKLGDDSLFWFVPDALRSLWYYSGHVLDFHSHLLTPKDHPHPWESKPWGWPISYRPMLYYYESGAGAPGCGRSDCVGAVMLIGTPALWWLSPVVLLLAAWRAIGRFDWRYGAVLWAYLVGYLPWYLNIDRQMYFFYATPLAPFLVLAITLALGEVLGRARAGYERRSTGLLVLACYVGLVVANFVWLWPILVGDSITPGHWQAELWLPSWR